MGVGLSPERAGTNFGRFMNMFITVIVASVMSAPGNELRGYCLQPPAKALPFKDFFKPEKFVRSTTVGAFIMAISLGVGTLATPQVEKLVASLRAYFKANPLGIVLVVLFALHNVLESRRQQQLSGQVCMVVRQQDLLEPRYARTHWRGTCLQSQSMSRVPEVARWATCFSNIQVRVCKRMPFT